MTEDVKIFSNLKMRGIHNVDDLVVWLDGDNMHVKRYIDGFYVH